MMICKNCNNEYPDDAKSCTACGIPANVKTEFSFKKFFTTCKDYFKINNFSVFQLIMAGATATVTLLFIISCCNGAGNSSMSEFSIIAAGLLTAFTILRYDTTTMPMAIAYSAFVLPNIVDCFTSFRYLLFAPIRTIFGMIIGIILVGILTLIWLVTTKVIKNASVVKLIIIFASATVCLYELVWFFICLFTNFISALYLLATIGFIGLYAAMMLMNDKKRIFGVFTGKNKKPAAVPAYTTAPAEVREASAAAPSSFCSHCGTKLPANTVFCPNCGNKIN